MDVCECILDQQIIVLYDRMLFVFGLVEKVVCVVVYYDLFEIEILVFFGYCGLFCV